MSIRSADTSQPAGSWRPSSAGGLRTVTGAPASPLDPPASYRAGNHTSPAPSVRVKWKPQQPLLVRTKPVPHSSPGRCQVEPKCGSGANHRLAGVPSALLTAIRSGPLPVIRQTILTRFPTGNGTVVNSSPHSSAPWPLPRTSPRSRPAAGPVGEAGRQLGAPSRAVVAAGACGCPDVVTTGPAGLLLAVQLTTCS